MGFEEVDSKTHLPLHLRGVHVLLVDYDPISLSNSALVLRKASFKVTPTKIQQVALTLLQEFKGEYNLLITSDQKQDMDCHSFIQRIRFIQQHIPIIVISSLENNADPGLRTLFDSACYVVNKPVTEYTLWCVWQRHQMKTRLLARRQFPKRKDQLVIENVEESESCGGKESVGDQAEYSPVDPEGKEHQREEEEEENRTLKRSKPCENEEEEVARKKGKHVAEPSHTNGRETVKGKGHKEASCCEKKPRPTFDPQQHKLLMEAIAYGGPTKHMNMTQYIPIMGQQVPPIGERHVGGKNINQAFHTAPRAPWTQYLYDRFVTAMSYNSLPGMGGYGYGVQQAHPLQMMCQRLPPSWVSPVDWRAQLNSEFLNNTSDVTMGCIPMFGWSDQYRASVLGFNGTRVNGMDQTMSLGTQSNPIVLDEVSNNGAQDEMRFGSFGHDNSLLSVLHTEAPKGSNEVISSSYSEHLNSFGLSEAAKGNTLMNNGYGQNFASNSPITNTTFKAEQGSIFQSTNGVLSTESQVNQWPNSMPTDQEQMSAYSAVKGEVEEYVNHEDVKDVQAKGSPATNQVATSANEESNKQGSEEEEKTENLSSDVDEFAEFFAFLENDTDEGGTSSGSDKANEVEEDSYFDIDSFDFSCGDPKI